MACRQGALGCLHLAGGAALHDVTSCNVGSTSTNRPIRLVFFLLVFFLPVFFLP